MAHQVKFKLNQMGYIWSLSSNVYFLIEFGTTKEVSLMFSSLPFPVSGPQQPIYKERYLTFIHCKKVLKNGH